MTSYRAINIVWDCDGEDSEDLGLPYEVIIEAESPDDIADALSEKYGWCVLNVDAYELP